MLKGNVGFVCWEFATRIKTITDTMGVNRGAPMLDKSMCGNERIHSYSIEFTPPLLIR